ncbi:hypothetical protein [Zunongwangia endophytica]|uniref:Haem-binding uptake Tiki superfamily ChaN domain-containing protein n=1 Tax=Zunongwangia endophytica TaxID=1808945 RepID=A0ABV8H5C2_9FLAO|nr:hypothetical protein [Zunongwangia endophytica]MDN3595244.1 hypothetical protein [Zunongwangia endophytica]
MSYQKISLLVFILTLLLSCNAYHPLAKYNYVNGAKLINKEAEISVQYFGDTHIRSPYEIDRKSLAELIRKYPILHKKNLLAFSKTTVNPEYKGYLFLTKKYAELEHLDLPVIDTLSQSVLFGTKNNKRGIYLLLTAVNKNTSIQGIIKDGEKIVESVQFKIDSSNALTYSKVFENVRNDINYLKSSKKIIEAPVADSLEGEWMQYQYLTTINSFMQNNEKYDSLIDQFESKRMSNQVNTLKAIHKSKIDHDKEALDKISKEAEKTRVVMVNENHWYPKHRIFTISLLQRLKNQGYNYLALESLSSAFQASKINQSRPYPTLSSGYYIQEAYFAHLIRKAVSLGYKIISYENTDNAINREVGQAQNLFNYIKQDSKAKILVHAGIDHILEEPTKNGKWMATVFKEISGIDPLTINQVEMIEEASDEIILMPFDQLVKDTQKVTDYYVVNNLKTNLKNIYSESDFKIFTLNLNAYRHLNLPLLIKIYNKNEFDIYKKNAVPVLNLKMGNYEKLEIELPVNNYSVLIMDKNGETSELMNL